MHPCAGSSSCPPPNLNCQRAPLPISAHPDDVDPDGWRDVGNGWLLWNTPPLGHGSKEKLRFSYSGAIKCLGQTEFQLPPHLTWNASTPVHKLFIGGLPKTSKEKRFVLAVLSRVSGVPILPGQIIDASRCVICSVPKERAEEVREWSRCLFYNKDSVFVSTAQEIRRLVDGPQNEVRGYSMVIKNPVHRSTIRPVNVLATLEEARKKCPAASPDWGGPLGWDRFFEITVKISRQLHRLAQNQTVYGDLKASNVFMDKENGVRFADVSPWSARGGRANHHSPEARRYIQKLKAAQVCATSAKGHPLEEMTLATDIYSFGKLMRKLLNFSALPFLRAIPPMPNHPQLANLIAHCLKKNPHERPDIKEVQGILQGMQASEQLTNMATSCLEENPSLRRGAKTISRTVYQIQPPGQSSSGLSSDPSSIW